MLDDRWLKRGRKLLIITGIPLATIQLLSCFSFGGWNGLLMGMCGTFVAIKTINLICESSDR